MLKTSFNKLKDRVKRAAALLVLSAYGCFLLSGCLGREEKAYTDDKLLIVTTLFPQYDFAKQVAGNRAEVKLMLAPGVDAHTYEPTPSDIIMLNKADIFIYTGDEMEPWVRTILDSVDNKNLLVVDAGISVTDRIKEDEGDNLVLSEEDHEEDQDNHEDHEEANAHEHNHSHEFDPHIWTSPVNAMIMTDTIAEAICGADEDNRKEYMENARAYKEQIEEIDSEIREIVSDSSTKTIYFGGRFAMAYFAHEYGLKYVAAFDSCTSESEPSARLIAKIIDKMREDNAKVVMYEELTDPRAANIIAEEIGGDTRLLHSCHNVSKSDMKKGVTYVSLMRNNVEALREALK